MDLSDPLIDQKLGRPKEPTITGSVLPAACEDPDDRDRDRSSFIVVTLWDEPMAVPLHLDQVTDLELIHSLHHTMGPEGIAPTFFRLKGGSKANFWYDPEILICTALRAVLSVDPIRLEC